MRKFPIAIGIVLLSVTTLLALKVKTEHDPEVDFSSYRTYSWKPATILGTQRPPEEVEAFVRRAVDAEMKERGMTVVEGDADLVATFLVTTDFNSRIDSFDQINHLNKFGYGATSIWGHGWNEVMVENYTQGTLIIDLIDAGTNQLVWRAYARETIKTTQKNRQAISKAIKKSFKSYPPR